MKPTSQISMRSRVSDPRATTFSNSKSAVTDWAFQSPTPTLHGRHGTLETEAADTKGTLNLWSLSQSFDAAEKREYRVETLFLAFVAAVAAWPIWFAFYMASETVR